MADPVQITVDGRRIEAQPGELVIAAAEREGVYVPRFCYHPRMKPVGMCRMCLVEVEGPRGPALQVSCMLPVAPDMVVHTQSERVKKAQDGVLEFLLINHPLDCPVCDKGGECPLQDQTLAFGPGESRFVEEKRHYEKPIALSDLVLLDRERCILCDRCTRFADTVAGDPLISFVDRGGDTQVLTFPDEPFASYFSGNTVQICPVGALTAKPFRFKARPWDLEQVESTCQTCAVGCRIGVQSQGNVLTRFSGVDSEAVNWGWLCDKGRWDHEAVNSEERLAHPMVRKGDEHVEASWSEALRAAADAIKTVQDRHGPGAIGVLGGARLDNEAAYAWAKLAKSVLGTDSVDCQLGDGLPAEAVLGLPRATIEDACRASAVLLLAPDVKDDLPVLYLRLREAAVDRGVPLVELTPQATGLTRHAAATLTYRPGEAVSVARALVSGAGGADVAGVPAASIEAAREVLGRGPVVVVLGRPSLAESGQSVAEAAAVLAGGLPDVRFLSALRRGNVHGALDMGLAPGVLPGRVSLDQGRQWFLDAWGSVPEERGMDATGMLTAAAEGRLHALVLLGADPLGDFPDRDLARRALAGAGFVLAVDVFPTGSVRQADVVLPAATFTETNGTTTNIEGRLSRVSQKVVPPGTAKADWIIAVELAQWLGADLGFESVDDVWDEIGRLAPSHQGVSLDVVTRARDGVVVPLGGGDGEADAPEPAHAAGDLPSEPEAPAAEAPEPADEEGTAKAAAAAEELAPDAAEAAEPPAPAEPPLPSAVEFTGTGYEPPAVDSYSLRLVATRKLWDAGTIVQHCPSLAHLAPGPTLRANPYDLDRLGVSTGGRVRLSSARGSLVLPVTADDGVPRGSASLTFAQPGDGAADLIDATAPVTDVRMETV